ncbi:hypothetical protein E4V01_24475 [Methylorubrum sp. Q1]|uniref:hypothetical protein n=1 Tax=Methylorubrum sp. Q1 TaxID=2562453 RepID=UPI0010762ABE|nr:hypothetical protein [Methylorubrum sp. Q1]TFZ54825.1 hypothetical protein E4V01_24475 [Methylorubrum sp. Q1]
MGEVLTAQDWVTEDKTILSAFTQVPSEGRTFFGAGCVAYTPDQLGLPDPGRVDDGSEPFGAMQVALA